MTDKQIIIDGINVSELTGEQLVCMNNEQPKYYFYLDNPDNELISDFTRLRQFQGAVYCLDKNFKDVAIQEIGEERLKKYLRGE